MAANIGQMVADAWDRIVTLEGPAPALPWEYFRDLADGRPRRYRCERTIKTGEWRGKRYWKVWNFRPGSTEWRER